jgi:aminopeptidase N
LIAGERSICHIPHISMTMKVYRYNKSAFLPLPVRLRHMDIELVFCNGVVAGTATQTIEAREERDQIILDAQDLEIRGVEWLEARADAEPLAYRYDADADKLIVDLPRTLRVGEIFRLRTRTVCTPSSNILEGIYLDTTPEGCPQQYMSQCQQWGFQRILPVFDDCTAKCTMRTTIEADSRYTHLISNGNVCRDTNPSGKPEPKPGDPSRQVVTYVNDVPMAPYLFLVCVGTWDVLEDAVTYPSGKTVCLEYLVPPGRVEGARVPMQILRDSVLWQGETQEYTYPLDVYRTICMEKSNFGGMENLGNTTIITSAALVDAWTGDQRLQYAYGVIVHEFEHNQCGSDVTMETPFDMWLNEAFTVDVERQFLMSRFDPVCVRLDEVDSMRAPLSGPLAVEDGGHMGNIVREGFNHPDELVDGVTYVKAAEVIRMLRLILGEATFREAKNAYFEQFKGSNANTDDFFACFERASGRNLDPFRREWLHTIGYPNLEADHVYDAQAACLRVTLKQTRRGEGGLFHVPLALAAVSPDGQDIPETHRVVEITEAETVIDIPCPVEPAFVSYNRDCSFYGTFSAPATAPETLALQVRLDPSGFNRVEAMRALTDRERVRLIVQPEAVPEKVWLDAFGSILNDADLPPGLRSYLLRIDEQSLDRRYLPYYRERYRARLALIGAVAKQYSTQLANAFDRVDTYAPVGEPRDGMEERRLKAILLRLMLGSDTETAWKTAETHFRRAWHITDRVHALACINASGHPNRRSLMEEAFQTWKAHLTAYTSYLSLVGHGIHEDVFENIRREEARPEFKIDHPGHSRALFLPMAGNNKMLWTDAGIDWVRETVCRLAPINENTALRLVSCFQLAHQLADDLKPKVLKALEDMRRGLDASITPSIAGRIEAYLHER